MKTLTLGFLMIFSLSAQAAPLAIDATSGYSWGNYFASDIPEDTHAGVGIQTALGYRIRDFEVGPVGRFAFPQINSTGTGSDASFTAIAAGLRAGYLWRSRVEPFLQFFPYAQLAQTVDSRLETAIVHTSLLYRGYAFGAGTKVYLTDRQSNGAQMGMQFTYTRERYSSSRVQSQVEPLPDHAAPSFIPASATREGSALLTGNTYELGVFIGI